MKIVCLLFQDAKFLIEIAEACYRFTPQITLGENAVFLEIGACEKIYQEKTIMLMLEALLKRFGVRARVGVSDDAALSLSYARWGKRLRHELPLEALYDVPNPFKRDEELFKKIKELILVLKKLGICQLADFLKLPAQSLSSRFRILGLELHRQLNSSSSHLFWIPFIPSEKIEESMNLQDFDHCQTLEPLLFFIKNILNRAMARLAGRSERVVKFELKLELEKHSLMKKSLRHWEFTLPLPQGSVTSLLPLIQERLQTDFQKFSLESWVNNIQFVILETVPSYGRQKNLFNKREEEQEAWSALIGRLCEKLGQHQAFTAAVVESFRPEKSWKKDWQEIDVAPPATTIGMASGSASASGATSDSAWPFPQRPLRLLKEPSRLYKVDNFLEGEAKRWEIRDWEGPERLSGEWWDDPFERDYFRIGTKTGEQLWVYRIPESDKLFLHGYFD